MFGGNFDLDGLEILQKVVSSSAEPDKLVRPKVEFLWGPDIVHTATKLHESTPGPELTYQNVDHSGTVANVENPTYEALSAPVDQALYEHVDSKPQASAGLSEVTYSEAAASGVQYADPSLPNPSSVRAPSAHTPTTYATVTVPSSEAGNGDDA
ncbi:hypothetical protein CAOG_06959 [Capsaspora owczarzaki ATCC 30864]|uniref:Uncharacterized protein n=1 Tax=Capsaspora owczarzaki (strain ATCC 30864) TaxID=595528 RepID=A0A0D2UNY9_CAPO3|nr:hypothetical protein CAOG_06959 [Capsaspora owczarzaki ATCC 30864]KJE96676.1 hypothetical protein CAOG_006959 [Capsaspora owczarzaki ATCC 30864]|eukprot:XP_004343683.1 hypothetical protein CAOG_06959 [Capsaspora owczarzaki ATCC 30864]